MRTKKMKVSVIVSFIGILLLIINLQSCQEQLIERVDESSATIIKNASNVKILTFNIGMGARRLYSGYSGNVTPALTDLRFGDFNGDGLTDIFSKFGDQWRYAPSGEYGWIDLNSSSIAIGDLRFGDFDGDGITDVFSKSGSQWRYSSGGVSSWIDLNSASTPLADLRFGDFNGDGKTDIFSVSESQWRYSSGGISSWIDLNSASIPLADLRFGDFDGDSKTDIFSVRENQWRYSSGGVSSWIDLNSASTPLADLRFGDFDGDGKTDIFSKNDSQWRYSSGGVSSWINLNSSSVSLTDLRFEDFDNDNKTDVFSISSGNDMRYSSGGVSSWIYLNSSYMLYCDTQSSCVKPLFLLDESISRIANFIGDQFPTDTDGIICLQEVHINVNGMNILDSIKSHLGGTWDYTFYSPIGNSYGIASFSNLVPESEQLWALPQSGTSEKRGAIAQKFTSGSKSSWIVNTHLGLTNAEREAQVAEIIKNYQTFDTINSSIIIVGDLNIIDTERLGSSFTATADQITHYNNTIGDLINSGMNKLEYKSTEVHPYTFHSWNGNSTSKLLDYILYRDPAANVPEITNLTPGPFDAEVGCVICPDYLPTNRYLSDHNGVVLEYPIFGY